MVSASKLIRPFESAAAGLRRSLKMEVFQCPECKSTDLRVIDDSSWYLKHWIWNPGLAFNELVLGQRIPAVVYVCNSCKLSDHNSFAKCDSCENYFRSQEVGAFGHYSGICCPCCDEPVVCLRNKTAGVLLRLFRKLRKTKSEQGVAPNP